MIDPQDAGIQSFLNKVLIGLGIIVVIGFLLSSSGVSSDEVFEALGWLIGLVGVVAFVVYVLIPFGEDIYKLFAFIIGLFIPKSKGHLIVLLLVLLVLIITFGEFEGSNAFLANSTNGNQTEQTTDYSSQRVNYDNSSQQMEEDDESGNKNSVWQFN